MDRYDDRIVWTFIDSAFRQEGGDVVFDAQAVNEAVLGDATRSLMAFFRRHGRQDGGVFRVPLRAVEALCARVDMDGGDAPGRPSPPLRALRAVRVADIDVDEALRHFDLPIDGQMDERSIRGHLSGTKKALLALFKGQGEIALWRGMTVPDGWADRLAPGAPLGVCWAWSREGAMRGSSLDVRAAPEPGAVLLRGRVSADDIDWPTTIAVNAFSEEENEIVLLPHAEVVLDAVLDVATGADLLPDDVRGAGFASFGSGEDEPSEGPSFRP